MCSPARLPHVKCQCHKSLLEFLSQERYSQMFYVGETINFSMSASGKMAPGKFSNINFLEMFLLSFPTLKKK